MEEYYDKQIYQAIKSTENKILQDAEEETEKIIDILSGSVYIDDEKVFFEEKEVIPERLKMYLPKDFHQMPIDVAKFKYPHENRPKYIYTNEECSINMSVTPKEDKITKDDLNEIKLSLYGIIDKLNPSTEKIGEDILEGINMDIPYFEFMTSAIDTSIYNLMFFLCVSEKLILGSFNCMIIDMDEWAPVAKEMLKTFTLEDEKI